MPTSINLSYRNVADLESIVVYKTFVICIVLESISDVGGFKMMCVVHVQV